MRDKFKNGYYENKFSVRGDNPDKFKAYFAEAKRLKELFKVEALEEVGLKDHPKAEKAWEIVWNRGSGAGYDIVFMYLEELADLMR